MEGIGLSVLHAGCGREPLPDWLAGRSETRLDLNPACEPDIVGPMESLGDIGPFDAVYCSHALEHLPRQGVRQALREFRRVLAPDGLAIIMVPDLEGVSPTDEVLFHSPGGPIRGIDMIYGHESMSARNEHMRHLTGFVKESLRAMMQEAGFSEVRIKRLSDYNLFGAGKK